MTPPDAPPEKICVVCGKDCSSSPRTKDSHGRYYHRTCHDKAMKRKAVSSAPPAASARAPADAPTPRAAVEAPSRVRAEPAEDDDVLNLLNDMSAAEARAEAVEQEQKICPNCKSAMPVAAVICMRCGYNEKLGRGMGQTRVEATAAPAEGRKERRDPRPLSSSRRSPGSDSKDWLAGAVPLVIFVVLFLVARNNPQVTLLYLGLQALFGLAVHLAVAVAGFKSSTGQGLLCLCVPFYALYFVFAVSESPLLKWAYTAAIGSGVLGRVLDVPE